MKTSEIPGYLKAQSRADRLEDYWRDFAFLGINDEIRISGNRKIEVRLFTLRMFVELCAVRSPFLVGGRLGPEHVAQILWRLSPQYDMRGESYIPKGRFLFRVRCFLAYRKPTTKQKFIRSIADLPFHATVRAINRYLDRMLSDRPPTSVKDNGSKPDTSFAASIIHALGSTYGWSDESILNMPMPRIFQYLRCIRRENDSEAIQFNPLRDRLTNRVVQRFFERRKAEHEMKNPPDRIGLS